VGAEPVSVPRVEVADRAGPGRERGVGDISRAEGLVAGPVPAELVVLKAGVVEVCEAVTVEVPEVVHVDVVLDQELPVAPRLDMGRRHLAQQARPVTADVGG